jgi:hypothetical protein
MDFFFLAESLLPLHGNQFGKQNTIFVTREIGRIPVSSTHIFGMNDFLVIRPDEE